MLTGKTTGDAKHHYAYTDMEYDDFEMHAMVKMSGEKANSGVCVRLQPTSFDDAPGYQIDMGDGYWGSLWEERRDGMVQKCPDDKAREAREEGRLEPLLHRCARGDTIQAWLNGVQTIDTVHRRGLKQKGAVGFQICHGEDRNFTVSFKGRLPASSLAQPVVLLRAAEERGWFSKPLQRQEIWSAGNTRSTATAPKTASSSARRRAAATSTRRTSTPTLCFRFEFKVQSGANNGVGIRARYDVDTKKTYDAAYHGMEIQVLENTAPDVRGH